jgi:hypothetical protein
MHVWTANGARCQQTAKPRTPISARKMNGVSTWRRRPASRGTVAFCRPDSSLTLQPASNWRILFHRARNRHFGASADPVRVKGFAKFKI